LKYGIGIDSGGTFTDGVMMELGCGKIISKAKVPTTHDDLIIGIRNCFTELMQGQDYPISRVCLSTTLATNAVVEGKGWDVGVLLVGHEPKGDIPSSYVRVLKGGHDASGVPLQELDLDEVEDAIASLEGRVDAFAVSSLMSVRNPEHELKLKARIRAVTGCPVVCGHELTSILGVQERTVTAVLNARLLPVILHLILDVQEVLRDQGITAPLMLVKGDGTLFPAENALERPIETLLSGPAASISGARYLSGKDSALIADMGGTTTDIAMMVGGIPKVSEEGATVGGWLTRVRAVELITVGLGGDSYIQSDKNGKLVLGPRRVVPVSVAAKEFPGMLDDLHELSQTNQRYVTHQPLDFFYAGPGVDSARIPGEQERFLRILAGKPCSMAEVAKSLQTDPDLLPGRELENKGIIQRISLTPTDLLVAQGRCPLGDEGAALLAIGIMARALHLTVDGFYEQVNEEINRILITSLLQKVMKPERANCHPCPFIIDRIMHPSRDLFALTFQLKVPLVAVGAPAAVYFPPAAEKLQGDLILPQHAEVANAVGAIISRVVEEVHILIRPLAVCGYRIFAPWGRLELKDQDLAVVKEKATGLGKNYIKGRLTFCKERDIDFYVEAQDIMSDAPGGGHKEFFIETRLKVKGIVSG
jgi:N-methylhydantoinase A/oxoprolinase/acetone carboxylase beta subunit